MNVRVKFLGGAGTVTGSRFLLDIGGFRLLFDCGLFQGLKELRLRNREIFPVDVSTIDAVVISHAHIDHTGYLPKLVREGYNGPIYCTPPTADLMELMLLDAAKLQEEEASYARARAYSKHANPMPLYDTQDAQRVLTLLRPFHYGEVFQIADNISAKYSDAGHLLGAAITEVFVRGDHQKKKIVFSGDLGRYTDAMLNPPTAVNQADILFVESTYGNRDNPAVNPEIDLEHIVRDTVQRGGVLLIPAFAVGRTQTLLYHLRKMMEDNRIPDLPVYIDSPMATSATYLYYKYPQYHNVDFSRTQFARELETNMLVFVKTSRHSKMLNEIRNNAIIISSSGMMTGGRILHHMYHRLRNPHDTILVAGFQAAGTRGESLVNGDPIIRIFGEDVPVKCKVENMTSLSGHADREELFQWLSNIKDAPKITFTVHGEGPDLDMFAQAIRRRLGWQVMVPKYMESFDLFEGI